jgi:hypothetical protein
LHREAERVDARARFGGILYASSRPPSIAGVVRGAFHDDGSAATWASPRAVLVTLARSNVTASWCASPPQTNTSGVVTVAAAPLSR